MATLSNPHDHFFKAMFSRPEVAGDFLRRYLPPAVVGLLEVDSLTIRKDSFVDKLHRIVEQAFARGDEVMATIAEEWVREGRQQGLQQGLQQGIPQGEALVLRRLLTRRFGPLPEWVEARLQKAESAQLEAWAERVLEAATLEAVFAD